MNAIEQLTQLQKELGYKENTEISPVALLGLFGEAGEVLNETFIHTREEFVPIQQNLFGIAINSAEMIDDLKKKLRKNPEKDYQVYVNDESFEKFDLEVADVLYYLNIIALNRGKNLDHYASLSHDKVRSKMDGKPSVELQVKPVIKNAELLTNAVIEHKSQLVGVMNEIIMRDSGILDFIRAKDGFNTFDVSISVNRGFLEQLVNNVEEYMEVSRTIYNCDADPDVFDFSLIVDLFSKIHGEEVACDGEDYFYIKRY